MTLDFTLYRETGSLIQSSGTNFYPLEIPPQHQQLKHFIRPCEEDIIYYASEQDVFALHLSTKKKELIASLPWEVQCLDAGHGWVGVGGADNGRCAFISVGSVRSESGRDWIARRHAEVDALLPLDLDPESRTQTHNLLEHSQTLNLASIRRRPEVQIHEIGGLIVNSVAIFNLRGEHKGVKDEIVAALTNNDQTVRIYSLSQSRELTTLKFPTAMNHASISPNGKVLIAVGDEPVAYFCQRISLTNLAAGGETTYARYEWQIIAEPRLSLMPTDDCLFTTAFSPSGQLCATASEKGVIMIFDTKLIRDNMDADDAVLAVMKSSRPVCERDKCGAVRSMSFSPDPWDLLVWAEDQGRICVIDLRSAFRSRQVVNIEADSPELSIINILDHDDSQGTMEQRQLEIEARFMQRHREALEAQDQLAAVSHAADYLNLAAQRRRVERETLGSRSTGLRELREELHGLTEIERQAVEMIRASREYLPGGTRETDVDHDPDSMTESERQMLDSYIRLRRIHENDSGLGENTHPDPTAAGNESDVQEPTGTSASLSLSTQSNREIGSIHDFMRLRNLERHRSNDRSYQPRRRSSVVISNSNSQNTPSSSHPSNLAPTRTTTPPLSASPSRLPPTTEVETPPSGPNDPWQTISDAMVPGPLADAASRLRAERTMATLRSLDRRGPYSQRLIQQRNSLRQRQLLTAQTGSALRAVGEVRLEGYDRDLHRRLQGRLDAGVVTMGVGWSADGRNLFVGTEDGIFEFKVNLDERKTFPARSLL